ncbi:MAG: aminomethyl-transferring glycine dehydrogenase subunit GcvPB, partial [Firmicutes bacterium]|nr:aminomethyl-transferring glycine dehydrogenase subunit GcvPB [Bacillota bacterium]
MKLLFERSVPGRRSTLLPPCSTPDAPLPEDALRKSPAPLPQLAEIDVERHYTELAKQTYGVNDGFYPLGSCTMKYNPSINEELAALPGFTGIHPLQPEDTVQGSLE